MKILKSYLVSKYGALSKCEDAIVVNDHFACVIDGATSKTEKSWNGKTSGMIASILISNTVKSFPSSIDGYAAIQELSYSIANFYKQKNIYEYVYENPPERTTGSVVLYSKYHNEVWMVGDCQCLVDDTLYTNNKIVDEIAANARAIYLELELISGKSISDLIEFDTGREFIMPILKRQYFFQNSNQESLYSYGAIDGFEINKSNIKIVKMKANTKHIILASDGYPKLMSTLEESEKFLKILLQDDPLCIRSYRSTKGLRIGHISYDDRAYLKIEL